MSATSGGFSRLALTVPTVPLIAPSPRERARLTAMSAMTCREIGKVWDVAARAHDLAGERSRCAGYFNL